MAIDLTKGVSSSDEQSTNISNEIQRFKTIKCICVWRAALNEEGKPINTDLDLSCVAFNEKKRIIDHVYSPNISEKLLAHYGMPFGKLQSGDNAIVHLGDTAANGSEEYQSETIVINLAGVSSDINRLMFFVNSPDFSFDQLPYFVAGFIGVASDGQEYELGLYNNYDKDKKALIFPTVEKNDGLWSLSGEFSSRFQDNIGETISSFINEKELANCPDSLNNKEIAYRINDVHFNQGDDDEKYGSFSKAFLYGLVVAVITAFLRFGYDWIVDYYFGGKAWMIFTGVVYVGLSLFLGFTVQSQSSYKSTTYPIIGGLLILASIIMSDFMFMHYLESTYNVYVTYVDYLGILTGWGWVLNIGSVILVPYFAYFSTNK